MTDPQLAREWQPTHDVARLETTKSGMRISISGDDPYLYGPVRDYPAGQPLWLLARLKSDQGGMGQVFYFKQAPSEADSVRFPVRAGRWEEVRVPLPALGPGYRLRLDPPGTGGKCLVSFLAVSARTQLKAPDWPQPQPPKLDGDTFKVQSSDLELVQAHHQWGGFVVRVAGKQMATGFNHQIIGYLHDGQARYFDLDGESAIVTACMDQNAVAVRAMVRDPDGGTWELHQRFAPGKAGTLEVTTQVKVDQSREVVFLPLLMLLPGMGSFGQEKHQALFAGLEYLDRDEPSSSEADVIGPAASRQTPDTHKITLPLMAIQQDSCYVGLAWDKSPQVTALFDSPDRLFHSGAHVMGLLFPGSDDSNRQEGSLLPYAGERLGAGQELFLRASILGGRGDSVVPAVQQYTAIHGLPPISNAMLDWNRYSTLAMAGWLDSGIHVGDRFRHAYPNFPPQPAADAALMLDYLSAQTKAPPAAARLSQAARQALTPVSPAELDAAGVGHVRYPAPSLVFGHAMECAATAARSARELRTRFEPDGSVRYVKQPGGEDLGKTHFAPDANGLTAQVALSLLENAVASGDAGLIADSLNHLHALDKFDNTVPRGAQTWEVPLHTPDILASAYLTRAYTLGYELTGDTALLDRARYWAWTGVPFVYLNNPTGQPVGPYATIAVYGATHWVAPVWMGLPVQWCGLVYADALYWLAPYDPGGPWKRLADGITVSGIQQTWPPGSEQARQGLLPDSFDLQAQLRNDPAINPGTLFVDAIRFYDRPALYDYRICRSAGLILRAPGAITHVKESKASVSFDIEGWPLNDYFLFITGFKKSPAVRVNGQEVALSTPNQFSQQNGRLVLHVHGRPSVQIDLH